MALTNPFKWPPSVDNSILGSGNLGSYKGSAIGAVNYDARTDECILTGPDGTTHRIPASLINKPAVNVHSATLTNTPHQAKQAAASSLGSLLESEVYRHKLLAMRLRFREGEKLPYHDLFTSLSGDKVFVFVVQDHQAVTLEDEASMFPSDQLITSLRLLDK